MSSVDKQKCTAGEILNIIRSQVDPKAIIAGGAPRNWQHSMLANDLDIYLRSPFGNTSSGAEKLVKLIFSVSSDIVKGGQYDCSLALDIATILNFKCFGECVQLIFVRDSSEHNFTKHVTKTFDIGLCRVAWDGSTFTSRPEYDSDLRDKTMTFYPDELNDKNIAFSVTRHIPKMLEYFPDHKFQISTTGKRKKSS